MTSIKNMLRRFVRERSGATRVEYVLMVAIMAAISLTAATIVGTKLHASFESFTALMP